MKKTRIFFDIDGVLAEFNKNATIEQLYGDGYFRSLPPILPVIQALELLSKEADVEVYTLSSAFNDDCIKDKNLWLDQNVGFIKKKNRKFCYYGENKGKAIDIQSTDVLVDDLSDNLRDFEACGGRSIKMYNGINGTKGSWTGYSVRSTMAPSLMKNQIHALATMA